jgi:hypothetical protein
MVAAIASSRGLPLDTRDSKDFVGLRTMVEIIETERSAPGSQPLAHQS